MYEKLMKTPSNPQFSPFGPIKCREKTLINTKFLNSKVCFGGPGRKEPAVQTHFMIYNTKMFFNFIIRNDREYRISEQSMENTKNT